MMKTVVACIGAGIGCVLVFIACTTEPVQQEIPVEPVAEGPEILEQPEAEEAEEVQEEPQSVAVIEAEEVQEEPESVAVIEEEREELAPEEPEPEEVVLEEADAEPQQPEQEDFTVTEEIYEQTFGEIEGLITELNGIIRKGDYAQWRSYLTSEYIQEKSDAQFLKEASDSPILKKNDIVLRDLQDYFFYVVVPSRSQARLDKIDIVDDSHVKAIMYIGDEATILYQLVKDGGKWKVGNW